MRTPPAPSAELSPSPPEGSLHLSGIISALTFALDLTEGALPGHSLRCCVLGMRIGTAAGLNYKELASLYYALQMKDAGCSSNAARMSIMVGGGDDRALKNAAKLTDWRRPDLPYLRTLWRECRPQEHLLRRVQHLFHLATSSEHPTEDLIAMRCERGADIATHLQLGGLVADAVRHLDEHWDGTGYPHGKRGTEIPLLSRVCLLAQQLDVLASAAGIERAVSMVATRRKTWFDPELIAVAQTLHRSGRLWANCLPTDDVEDTRRAVVDLDPGLTTALSPERLDRICEAFAGIVDAKSPFTYRHSVGVMEVACAIAEELELEAYSLQSVRRAALLHDIGKLALSNSILDRPGELTEAEWVAVKAHPKFSGTILRRVPGFANIARIAEQHHERLDGSGYPNQSGSSELSMESRIIAMADCYSAMAESRPYREARPREAVLHLLASDVPHKLDPACFKGLRLAVERWPGAFPESAPASKLTAAEAAQPLNWTWPPLV